MHGRFAPGAGILEILAVALLIPVAPAPAGAAARGAGPAIAVGTPVRTGKERLSSKASDEQRVDNCKVPRALRGPRPRPDDCDHKGRGAPIR